MPTLALRQEHWQELLGALDLDVESAAFVLAGIAEDGDELSLFGRSLNWIADEHYEVRERNRLRIRSRGFWPFFGAAERDRAVPVFIHTHPRMSARPSEWDDGVDAVLMRLAAQRSRACYYVSLIVGGTAEKATFTGRVFDERGLVTEAFRLRVVGRRIHVLVAEGSIDAEIDSKIYERQIRAFGADGQRILARLRVGVVGAGGTGSAVFEQLVRTGFRDVTVIDDDIVTGTNVTRIHESGRGDIGAEKVAVMKLASERIGLGAFVEPIIGRVTDEEILSRLRHRDVIFGCTDDEKGRNLLSKLALTHLIPTFDMAFAIDTSEDGSIRALTGRVTTLLPGQACLLCLGRITPGGLLAEDLDPEERRRRAGEGYVPGLAENDPAVGTFTTLIGGLAVNELFDRLFGYSSSSPTFKSTELFLRLGQRSLNYTSKPASATHWCGDVSLYGRGDDGLA
jgi:molybdopterin/thiamine biosynthesis adenylyltransferase